MDQKTTIFVVLIVLLVVIIACKCSKKDSNENYSEVFLTGDYNNYMVQRPSFKGDLSPRFDPYREGGGNIRGSYPENFDVQSVGPNPLSSGEMGAASELDYATLGGETQMNAKFEKSCKKLDMSYNKMTESLSYTDPSQMLPAPDLRSCFKDPTNPENYMYDRTLFAPLKRRHAKNYVDYIRGDLYIPPNRFGWFDTPTIPHVDLVKPNIAIGQISGPDIDLEDTSYYRSSPTVALQMAKEQEELPWGDAAFHRS